MPIPLGGTSNHFKTQKLIEIGGWDPMNVAEDAELGMRIFKKGYKTQICQSYTMEEAPFKIQDWLPQRQRWMKGYLQTFACHLLDFKGNAKAGPKFFFGLCALVGFSFFSFLLVPFCFAASVIAVKSSALLKALIGINGFCSVLYFLSFFYICKKEGYRAAKMALYSVYFYFFLHCAAAIMGFWQFMARPFYWNKTPHSVK
jgi:cellulose synthase/poly-beta-1,6-N-acetylglucosamine synthase-like glycosyltransferase